MQDLVIYQGETLSLLIDSSDDTTAVDVRFIARKDDATSPVLNILTPFSEVDGKWVAQIQTTNTGTISADTYSYMLTVAYSDGTIKKLPDASECDGDCDLPTLKVCEAIDLGVS